MKDKQQQIEVFPELKWRINISNLCIDTTTAPNWFYRWMQKITLGIKWEKL